MMQPSGALGATTVDFAALLEAVALDPSALAPFGLASESVLGKAANSGIRRARAAARIAERQLGDNAPKAMAAPLPLGPRASVTTTRAIAGKGAQAVTRKARAKSAEPILESVLEPNMEPRAKAIRQPSIELSARAVKTRRGKARRIDSSAAQERTEASREGLRLELSTPSLRKPPKSLRPRAKRAERVEQNSVPQTFAAEPLPAALHEDLLASDTFVLRMPTERAEPVAALPKDENPPVRIETDVVARHWPGARRKCVTISVRLSPEDAKMLRRRANESELSISDYLRSCVLEADQLRAQVKQVLAEMRTHAPGTVPQPERSEPVVSRATPPLPEAQSRRQESRWQRWLASWRGPLVAG